MLRFLLASLLFAIAIAGDCSTGPDGIEDCDGLDPGNYQHCTSCKKYVVCDGSGGMEVKDTAPDKVFDANVGGEVWWSYTCSWDNSGGGGGTVSTDWRDITCITFDESPDPFQGSKGIYVKHEGVELEDECGDPESAGQCGYFPEGRAYLKMPYFRWTDFHEFSICMWFKRSTASSPDTEQTLINKYPDNKCQDSSFDITSKSADQIRIEAFDMEGSGISAAVDADAQDEWTHVCVTYDGSWDPSGTMTVKAYVNGELEYSNTDLRGRLFRNGSPVTIGIYDCHDGNYFHGYMDTISFAKKVLTLEQVEQLSDDRSQCFAD